MKKFLAIFLAIVMTVSMVSTAFAARYTDIADSDYGKAIENLSGLGVIAGYDDGTFQPEKVVTRAEMAKLLVVSLGLDVGASVLQGKSSFDDVPTTHWATGYIAVAVQYGLIKGDGDGNFRPDDTVNYAEASTMVLRALGYDRVVDKTGVWPTNYLNKANELKIFDEVGSIAGANGATRGTIAQMMWNMLNTPMWEVGSESENDGLTYGKGEIMLVVKFPEFNTASGSPVTYTANYIDNDTINTIAVYDKDTIIVTFTGGEIVYFDNVSPLELNKALQYSAFYKEAKVDGNKVNVGTSLYADENVVIGTITKESTDGKEITVNGKIYKNSTDAAWGATYVVDALVMLVLDNNDKVLEAKSVVYNFKANEYAVVKAIKESTDGQKTDYTAFTGGKSFTVKADDKTAMFVTFNNGVSKIIEQKDIAIGSVVQAGDMDITAAPAATLAATDLFIVTNKTISGTIDKMVDAKYVINDESYVIDTNTLVEYDDATPVTLTPNEKNLIGETVTLTLNELNEVIFAEANDSVATSNYGFVTEAWAEMVNNELVYKVKIVDMNGDAKVYESYDFTAAVNASKQVPTTVMNNAVTITLAANFKAASYDSKPISLVKYSVKDGKIDVNNIKVADTTIVDVTPASIDGNDINDVRKTIKAAHASATDYIVTNSTKILFASIDEANDKFNLVKADFDDLKTVANHQAAKIVLDKVGSTKADYIVIELNNITGAEKAAIIQSAENALDNDVYTISLFDLDTLRTITVELSGTYGITTTDIGDAVTYSISSNGKYAIDVTPTFPDATAVLVDDNDDNEVIQEAGIGYTTILRAGAANLVVKDSELTVVFVDDNGIASIGSIDSIRDGYSVQGTEQVSTSDNAYKTIIVAE